MVDASRLFEFAFSGRAVLLAGQGLEAGAGQRLLQALAEHVNLHADVTLADACTSLSEPGPILAAIRSLTETGTGHGLRRIAEIPWAAVFTSALDDQLSTELASQHPQGRRLRHLTVDDRLPAFFSRRNDVLTVLHLSHLANEQTATGLPLDDRHWGRRDRFFLPGILRDLPQ